MIKKRIIPILSYNGFALVKTKKFKAPRMLGNPIQSARVYNARAVDELIICDIYASAQNRGLDLTLLRDLLNECFMPVGVGGGIKTIQQIHDLLNVGADKVILKTSAIRDHEFVISAVQTFGAQCICIAIDVQKNNTEYVISDLDNTNMRLEDFVQKMNSTGVGEYMITSIDHDGMMIGYDCELAKRICSLTKLPVIFAGGAGKPEDYLELFSEADIDAAAAASIFHYTQFTPFDIKQMLANNNIPVRLVSN